MALVLQRKYHFWKEVNIYFPGVSETGEFSEPMTFKGQFLLPSQERLKEIGKLIGSETIAEAEQDAEGVKSMTFADLAREVLVDWQDVEDEKGKTIKFTPESLNDVLNIFGAPMYIVHAFYQALNTQVPEDKRKN